MLIVLWASLKMTFRINAHGQLFGTKVFWSKVRKPNYRYFLKTHADKSAALHFMGTHNTFITIKRISKLSKSNLTLRRKILLPQSLVKSRGSIKPTVFVSPLLQSCRKPVWRSDRDPETPAYRTRLDSDNFGDEAGD